MTPPKAPPGDPDRRAALLAAKLRSIVRRRWPEVDAPPVPAAGGMALVHGGTAWVLVDDTSAARGFARALLWGIHRGVAGLHVLAERSASMEALARQAACFRTPVTLWAVAGADLARVDPGPLPPEPPLDPDAEPFIPVIEAAGADQVVEWGVLTAEVLGLQVARVSTGEGGARLEVGIGEHDRLAAGLAWGELPPGEALRRVVEIALTARRAGAVHPLNLLGRERWLRRRLVDAPAVVGAERLEPVSPPAPFTDLRAPMMAPAVGTDADGRPILVACSVGFDPAFVPMAAELHAARARRSTGEELVLVVPESDVHALTQRAAADLLVPPTIRTVPNEWQAASSPERQ